MVVIASDHRLLKVSWRGEPWWTARCRPFGQEDTGRCDEQVGIGLLKAVDSVCFDMFWPLGVTFPGWNLPVNALLVSKRWSNFQQVPWSSFFLHNHNESHRITMNHNESQQISGGFAAGLGRRKNWFYGKLWRAPAQQCHTQGLVVKSVAIWERTLKGQKNQRPTELLDMSY